MVSTARRANTLLFAAALLAGCGTNALPSPTAGEMTDVVNAIVLRGATITDQVAGDTGCSEESLHSNAVRLDVRMPGETSSNAVYLFRWRRQSDFDAAEADFNACITEHATATGAEPVIVAVSPWRAYGNGWSTDLQDAVQAALTEAGGV